MWIYNFLKDRKQRKIMQMMHYPLLFLRMINDIDEHKVNSWVSIFADYTIIKKVVMSIIAQRATR